MAYIRLTLSLLITVHCKQNIKKEKNLNILQEKQKKAYTGRKSEKFKPHMEEREHEGGNHSINVLLFVLANKGFKTAVTNMERDL